MAATDGSVTILLGERGASKTFPLASIWLGRYERATGSLQMTPEVQGVVLPPLDWPGREAARIRGIGDLAMGADGSFSTVATQDPGNRGPFRSAIYRAGILRGRAAPVFTATRATPTFFLDGIKVEGLTVRPDGSFVFASDDESFGGAFGRLPAAASENLH